MLETLLGLSRAGETARAAAHDVLRSVLRIGIAHRDRSARRAVIGEFVRLARCGAFLEDDAYNLWDHVAGPLNDDGIADPHVFARDLILVVQRRIRDDDAADGDRLEFRHGCQGAGATDLNVDAEQCRRRLLGWELMCERPSRGAADEAEALLQVEPVDFVDDAIDVIAEARALQAEITVVGNERIGGGTQLHQRIDRQAPPCERFDHPGLRVGGQVRRLAPGVGEEAQRPGGGNRYVELAQRASRCIARVGEDFIAGPCLCFIEPAEVFVAQVDFAAHFDDIGDSGIATAVEFVRDLLDRRDVGGDVLAFGAIAPGGRLHEFSVLEAQRNR